MRIVWLTFAERDLLSIAAYYESVAGKAVAKRVVQRIVRSASGLLANPHLGHPSESTNGVHELRVVGLPYLLPYNVVDDRIQILRVFHQSQDRPSIWQGE